MRHNESVYMHEFQRPTLDQIISEGCKRIDEAVERVCAKYAAPQIEVSCQPEPLSYPDRQRMENIRHRGMLNSILNMVSPQMLVNASGANSVRIVDNVFLSASR